MDLLIRKFIPSKWDKNKSKTLQNYSAEAITICTKASGNALSTWATNSTNLSDPHNKKIIAALATSMQSPQTFDIIFFRKSELQELGLTTSNCPSESLISSINGFHEDIVNIDYNKLGIIAEHIVQKMQDSALRARISKKDVLNIVSEFIGSEIQLSDFDKDSSWYTELNKKIQEKH